MNDKTAIILNENDKRRKDLFSPYDPIKGIGSPIERFPVKLTPTSTIHLPLSMRNHPLLQFHKTLQEHYGKNYNKILSQINEERLSHDFEFWACVGVKIKPKKGGEPIRFIPNKPQRKILKGLEEDRLSNRPIRMILVKSRQYGGSTLIQVYMAWIQLKHKTNWNSLIAAHINQAASTIRYMFSTLQKNYPDEIGGFEMKPFENSSNVKIIPQRSNKITIGSMQTPDSIRSEDIAMAHLSELGLWKKTEGKSPEDLAQSILGTIPSTDYSMYVMESTAKGVGNFFHRSWTSAINGESNMKPVFVAWHEIEMYQEKFDNEQEKIDFINKMNEYDHYLWGLGATLEGIKWYKWKFREFLNDTWRMQSEFPSTAIEAFQSTGRRVFAPSYVFNMRKTCKQPSFIGDVFADEMKGEKSLENIRFDKTANGPLKIWKMPNDPPIELGKVMSNRYAAFADIGGASKGADFSSLSIFDRHWMTDGGLPERVLSWHGHIDQDLFAWKCAQICKMYSNALLAIEVNSLAQKDSDTEGDHFFTVLDEIVEHYENLYSRTRPEQIRQGLPLVYGFHTNSKTKGMIVGNYKALLRDSGYIEYDELALNEADTFEIKQNGITMGAVEGNHDDKLITTMGGLWLATNYMDIPELVEINNRPTRRTSGSMARM